MEDTRCVGCDASSCWPGVATGSSATSPMTGRVRAADGGSPVGRSSWTLGVEARPMRMTHALRVVTAPIRSPAVAGAFYPADPGRALGARPRRPGRRADRRGGATSLAATGLAGILVPHAGWSSAAVSLRRRGTSPRHCGIRRPRDPAGGAIADEPDRRAARHEPSGALARRRRGLGDRRLADAARRHRGGRVTRRWRSWRSDRPFRIDRDAHRSEHSIEVQLPFVATVDAGRPDRPARGRDGHERRAVEAGRRLGVLLAERRVRGVQDILAISTDMAHYPPASVAARVTEVLEPSIVGLDPDGPRRAGGRRHALRPAGRRVRHVRHRADRRRARRAVGDGRDTRRSRGGRRRRPTPAAPADRTVGYLSVAFSR